MSLIESCDVWSVLFPMESVVTYFLFILPFFFFFNFDISFYSACLHIRDMCDIFYTDKISKNFKINKFLVLIEHKVSLASGMNCVCLQYVFVTNSFGGVFSVWTQLIHL